MQRKSLLLIAPYQLEWIDEGMPQIQSDEILVQTLAGAVSVGTELPYFSGKHRGSRQPSYPMMTGYESIGQVLQRGSQVRQVAEGDRVLAFYGHRTHAVLKEAQAIPIPADISDALALLAILSCDVTKGINKTMIKPNDQVLLTGAGTIGLLTLFNLRQRGFEQVDILEPLTHRREIALHFGARTAYFPSETLASDHSYQIGFECSARNQAFERLQQLLQPHGEICVLSDGNVDSLVLSPHFHEKELRLVGSSDGEDYLGHAAWFFEQVRQTEIPLHRLYEVEVTAANLGRCFAEMAQASQSPIKVLVRYA